MNNEDLSQFESREHCPFCKREYTDANFFVLIGGAGSPFTRRQFAGQNEYHDCCKFCVAKLVPIYRRLAWVLENRRIINQINKELKNGTGNAPNNRQTAFDFA